MQYLFDWWIGPNSNVRYVWCNSNIYYIRQLTFMFALHCHVNCECDIESGNYILLIQNITCLLTPPCKRKLYKYTKSADVYKQYPQNVTYKGYVVIWNVQVGRSRIQPNMDIGLLGFPGLWLYNIGKLGEFKTLSTSVHLLKSVLTNNFHSYLHEVITSLLVMTMKKKTNATHLLFILLIGY